MDQNQIAPAAGQPAAQSCTAEAKKTFSRVGVALFVLMTLTLVLQVAVLSLMAFFPDLQQTGWFLWVATFAPVYLVAIPVTVWMLKRIPTQKLERHTLRPLQLLAAFAVSIAAMLIGNIIGTLLSSLLSSGTAENPLAPYTSQTSVGTILVVVILAPILEELVFRRLLIDRLSCYGGALAVGISSLCFAFYHMNLFQFFYAFAIGCVLGYVYLKTGDIRYNIGLHMTINLMGGVIAVNAAGMAAKGTTLGTAVFVAYLVVLYSLVIGGIVVLIRKRKQITFAPAEKPVEHGVRTAMSSTGMILYTVISVLGILFALFSGVLAQMAA
jgi:membrane protease YdiL (CAAX protease family)